MCIDDSLFYHIIFLLAQAKLLSRTSKTTRENLHQLIHHVLDLGPDVRLRQRRVEVGRYLREILLLGRWQGGQPMFITIVNAAFLLLQGSVINIDWTLRSHHCVGPKGLDHRGGHRVVLVLQHN